MRALGFNLSIGPETRNYLPILIISSVIMRTTKKTSAIPVVALAALSLAALLCMSCTALRLLHQSKLKAPQVAFVSYRVVGVEESQARVEFTLAAFNPNAIGLRNVTLGYELFHEGKRFLHGDDIQLEFKPKDTTRIVVPAVVVYAEVLRAAGPLAAKILMDKKSIPIRIDAVVEGKPTVYDEVESGSLFQFTLRLSRTESVPIPQQPVNEAKSAARRALKKLF